MCLLNCVDDANLRICSYLKFNHLRPIKFRIVFMQNLNHVFQPCRNFNEIYIDLNWNQIQDYFPIRIFSLLIDKSKKHRTFIKVISWLFLNHAYIIPTSKTIFPHVKQLWSDVKDLKTNNKNHRFHNSATYFWPFIYPGERLKDIWRSMIWKNDKLKARWTYKKEQIQMSNKDQGLFNLKCYVKYKFLVHELISN